MTIQSLQKIIQLEEELYRKEQLEQDKITAWIKEQQAAVEQNYEQRLAELDHTQKEFREKARSSATADAGKIISKAKANVNFLETLDDAFLEKSLQKYLPLIFGND